MAHCACTVQNPEGNDGGVCRDGKEGRRRCFEVCGRSWVIGFHPVIRTAFFFFVEAQRAANGQIGGPGRPCRVKGYMFAHKSRLNLDAAGLQVPVSCMWRADDGYGHLP